MLQKTKQGFSLLELMIVIAIMAIITTVSIFNYSKFNSNLSLTNLAYEVALSIREAQVFGGSAKVSGGTNFDNAYGVHFRVSEPAKFISFDDSAPSNISPVPPGDGKYNDNFVLPCDGECTTMHALPRGNILEGICRKSLASNGTCPGGHEGQSVDITFTRPNLDTNIYFVSIGGQDSDENEVYLTLSSPNGTKKVIKIQKTGQIAILD